MTSRGTNDYALERRRILRAAADGRLKVNDAGRYVIDGEERPERKARESLMRGEWPLIQYPLAHRGYACDITIDGRGELRDLEAMLGALA